MKLIIHDYEYDTILELIRIYEGVTLSVAKFAAMASYNPNRTRFIFDELLEKGKITKTIEKQYNERYIRYSYALVKEV